MGIHSGAEVKSKVTKEMALSLFDLRREDAEARGYTPSLCRSC